MSKRNTSFVFMWENPKGKREWEAITEDECEPFVSQLLESGVKPQTIICACNPMLFHWLFKSYHEGLSDVFFNRINEDICGADAPVHVEPTIKSKERTKSVLGWLSPDGRHFPCGYGGHSTEAARIVGYVDSVQDPCLYLESKGWISIFNNPIHSDGCRETVGMGDGQKPTDIQIKTLMYMGLKNAYGMNDLIKR